MIQHGYFHVKYRCKFIYPNEGNFEVSLIFSCLYIYIDLETSRRGLNEIAYSTSTVFSILVIDILVYNILLLLVQKNIYPKCN